MEEAEKGIIIEPDKIIIHSLCEVLDSASCLKPTGKLIKCKFFLLVLLIFSSSDKFLSGFQFSSIFMAFYCCFLFDLAYGYLFFSSGFCPFRGFLNQVLFFLANICIYISGCIYHFVYSRVFPFFPIFSGLNSCIKRLLLGS